MPVSHTLRGTLPWGTGSEPGIALDPGKGAAPRKNVAYVCASGCEFTIPLAEEAVAPDDWTCRCGAPARRKGAPKQRRSSRPGSGHGGSQNDVSEHGQLAKRGRSRKHKETLLAERSAVARQMRGADDG
jgi:hypothetical protein